jgi:hypothetical protein
MEENNNRNRRDRVEFGVTSEMGAARLIRLLKGLGFSDDGDNDINELHTAVAEIQRITHAIPNTVCFFTVEQRCVRFRGTGR